MLHKLSSFSQNLDTNQWNHDLIEKSENMFLNKRTSMRPTRTLLSEKKLIYKKEVPKGFR